MKRALFACLTVVLAAAVSLAAFEGVNSLIKGRQPHLSLSYQLLSLAGFTASAQDRAEGAYAAYFADPDELSVLVKSMAENSIGMGNSPFGQVRSGSAAINTEKNGCPALKPNLRKTAFFLRSSAFDPLEPLAVFFDKDKALAAPLKAFFDRYGGPRIEISTNDRGERRSFPVVDRQRLVLVAGDSVAFGAMVDDSDTIASQLQARDGLRQYVNLGVAGSDAAEIICRIEDAANRYRGRIDELIYVYCENDFKPRRPYGKPDEVVNWLKQLAAREGIKKIRVVFSPYIYTIAPEVTRFRGYAGETYPHRGRERLELISALETSGFDWIDIGLIAKLEEARLKTQFAIFGLFVDHNHLSPRGISLLVDELLG